MGWTRLAMLLAASLSSVLAVSPQLFYPYGPRQGDESLPPADDISTDEIQLSVPIVFFNSSFSSIYVSTHAYAFFSQEYTCRLWTLLYNSELPAVYFYQTWKRLFLNFAWFVFISLRFINFCCHLSMRFCSKIHFYATFMNLLPWTIDVLTLQLDHRCLPLKGADSGINCVLRASCIRDVFPQHIH